MKPFYKRIETQNEISLSINRYIPIYVVLSAVALPELITNKLVGETSASIIEINEILALILGVVWAIQMFTIRSDFIKMIKTKKYTMSGKPFSLKNPTTYHISKDAE